jgi:hypothetical protein
VVIGEPGGGLFQRSGFPGLLRPAGIGRAGAAARQWFGAGQAVRGLGLLALNDSLLWPALSQSARRARVFLLDPDCPAARLRAGEIGEAPAAFASGIRLAVERLRQRAAQPGACLALYLYQSRPVWRVIGLDDTLYVSGFASWEGHSSTMYKLLPTTSGALHQGFRRMLDDLAATSTRVV